MEVIIGALVLATLGFGGYKVAETANGITARYDVTFFSPAFYAGVAAAPLSFFAAALFAGGETLNGIALLAIACGMIYFSHVTNLKLIPDRNDALKLTVIQVVTGAVLVILYLAVEAMKSYARR